MTWSSDGSVQRERGDSRDIAAAAGVVYGLHYDVASKKGLPSIGRMYETIPYYCSATQSQDSVHLQHVISPLISGYMTIFPV